MSLSPEPIGPIANTIQVMFCHDMDSAWYEMQCPEPILNGSYDSHLSIEKIAKKRGWVIKWYGDQQYNPWRHVK